MIGVLVQLLISWLIIRTLEKKDLSVLGFRPNQQRLVDFTVFFLVTAAFSSSGFLLRMLIADQRWHLNPNLSFNLIISGIWWNIKSVLFEELIFRGVLLYILIKRTSALKAIIISSVAFGIYHWFSFGAMGNPVQMAIIFFTTGIMGLLYAYGYYKTFSLYVPCAIHSGWNLTQSVIFSKTVIGEQLLVQEMPVPVVTISHVEFYLILLFPMTGALVINYILLRKKNGVTVPTKNSFNFKNINQGNEKSSSLRNSR